MPTSVVWMRPGMTGSNVGMCPEEGVVPRRQRLEELQQSAGARLRGTIANTNRLIHLRPPGVVRYPVLRSRTVKAAGRAATLLLVASCYSYQRAETAAIPAYAEVRVRFASPQDVAIASSASGQATLVGADQLGGRVLSTTGDSLQLHVMTASDRTGRPLGLPADATTWVVRGPTTRVDVRRLSRGRTALLGGSIAGIAVLVVAAAVTVALLSAVWVE